jgi:hypothetical protein
MTIRNFTSMVKVKKNTVAPPLDKRSAINKASKRVEQDGYVFHIPKEKDSVKRDIVDLYKSLDSLFGDRIVRAKGPLSGDGSFSIGTGFDLVMDRYKKDIVEGSFNEKELAKKERLAKLRILLDPSLFYLTNQINDVTVAGLDAYEALFRLGAETIYENFQEHFKNNYQKYAFHQDSKALMTISQFTEIVKQTGFVLQKQLEKVNAETTSNVTGILAELYVNKNSPAVESCSQLENLFSNENRDTEFLPALAKEGVTYEHLCVFYANDHYPVTIEELTEYATLPIDWLEMILSGKE